MNDEFYDYIQEIKNYPVLSYDEQKELLIETKKGNKEAFLKLFHCNLKLVVSVARKYFNFYSSLSKMDIIQEGNLGLLNAIENFNIERIDLNKFSTYACLCIDSCIQRCIDNLGYTIRIPVNRCEELSKYRKVYNYLEIKLNRIPTLDELSKELNLSKLKIKELERIEKLKNVVSLNNSIFLDEEDDEYINSTLSDEKVNIEQEIIEKLINENLKYKIKNILTEKQYEIISLRYGLEDGSIRGQQEVADILNYPDRRHIYETEKRALKKLCKAIFNNENMVR